MAWVGETAAPDIFGPLSPVPGTKLLKPLEFPELMECLLLFVMSSFQPNLSLC